ncbi:hypothetical protein ARMGADRAFT_546300 [Armillaria gallica]|uniref:Uncharacterized protein n=1 Tax=Armillaria gallica TaxID=47427 RepID=A0A2H3DEF9_ARMGA|nr:hypothetical protein ARMGADRAFT_546300 [Armillaria gallica]
MRKVDENDVFGILIAGRNDDIFLTDAVHKTTLVDLNNIIQQNLDLLFRDGRDDAKTTYQGFRFVQQILVACRRRRFARVFVTYILGKRDFHRRRDGSSMRSRIRTRATSPLYIRSLDRTLVQEGHRMVTKNRTLCLPSNAERSSFSALYV